MGEHELLKPSEPLGVFNYYICGEPTQKGTPCRGRAIFVGKTKTPCTTHVRKSVQEVSAPLVTPPSTTIQEERDLHASGVLIHPSKIPLPRNALYLSNDGHWGIGVTAYGESPLKSVSTVTARWLDSNPWFMEGFREYWHQHADHLEEPPEVASVRDFAALFAQETARYKASVVKDTLERIKNGEISLEG